MSFIITNYVLLIMIVGLFILTAFDVFLGSRKITRLRIIMEL